MKHDLKQSPITVYVKIGREDAHKNVDEYDVEQRSYNSQDKHHNIHRLSTFMISPNV
jgi:hypothetical protein